MELVKTEWARVVYKYTIKVNDDCIKRFEDEINAYIVNDEDKVNLTKEDIKSIYLGEVDTRLNKEVLMNYSMKPEDAVIDNVARVLYNIMNDTVWDWGDCETIDSITDDYENNVYDDGKLW